MMSKEFRSTFLTFLLPTSLIPILSRLSSSLSGRGGGVPEIDQELSDVIDATEAQNQPMMDGEEDHQDLLEITVDQSPLPTSEQVTMENPFPSPSGDNYRDYHILDRRNQFYFPGESSGSRNRAVSFSGTSFTSRTSLNSIFKCESSQDKRLDLQYSFSSISTTEHDDHIPKMSPSGPTLQEVLDHVIRMNNHPKMVSDFPTPPVTNNNSPNSTLTITSSPEDQNQRPYGPSPNPEVITSSVLLVQELPKLVLSFTIPFIPAVMILHYTSHETLTRGMTVAIVFLLMAAVVLLCYAIMVQDRDPVHAHRVQILGFALSLAAVFGLISCFLWPSYSFLVPIVCWVILAGILGFNAFRF